MATLLLGIVTVAQYLFGLVLGIDQVLFREQVVAVVRNAPGRPSPPAATCFVLLGLALLLINLRGPGGRLARGAALVTACIAMQALIGYAYQEDSPFPLRSGGAPWSPMAVHTAVTFLLLSLGTICARPNRLMALMRSADVGGFLVRRLLPAAIVVPILLGWVALLGEWAGLHGRFRHRARYRRGRRWTARA